MMHYLTYNEYQSIGGTLTEAAFNRNIDRAELMIDRRTQKRLRDLESLPEEVKPLCRDLVEYIAENTVQKAITSRSQSAGGVSESESYATLTAEEYAAKIDEMFADYLSTVYTKNGICVLYKGAMS